MKSRNNYRTYTALPSGSGFGWGNCGTRLTDGLRPLGADPVALNSIGLKKVDGAVLQAIAGHEFGYTAGAIGERQIGYGFIENNVIAGAFLPLAERLWDSVISGSSWMRDALLEYPEFKKLDGGVCVQGVDPEVFSDEGHVEVKSDRFIIGSFGKFEYRKGQDVVIKAFKLFKMRHPDVLLVHCWGNMWPQLIHEMASVEDAMVKPPVLFDHAYYAEGHVFTDILASEGIQASEHRMFLNQTPNQMASIYRSCDVALFPNRCEAGTNLALHEALACGVPCIATDATGHMDLTRAEGYPCDDLSLVGGDSYVYSHKGISIGEWHKPCLEEILSQLEYAYINRDELRKRRKNISEWGQQWTWDRSINRMAELLGL